MFTHLKMSTGRPGHNSCVVSRDSDIIVAALAVWLDTQPTRAIDSSTRVEHPPTRTRNCTYAHSSLVHHATARAGLAVYMDSGDMLKTSSYVLK